MSIEKFNRSKHNWLKRTLYHHPYVSQFKNIDDIIADYEKRIETKGLEEYERRLLKTIMVTKCTKEEAEEILAAFKARDDAWG